MDAIVLVGHFGEIDVTEKEHLPKSLENVAGKPFLHYLIETLSLNGFQHIIIAMDREYQDLKWWLEGSVYSTKISLSVEKTPCKSGLAVKHAMELSDQENLFIFNSNMFLTLDYHKMIESHRESGAQVTLALKKLNNYSRYQSVGFDKKSHHISFFTEVGYSDSGYVCGGVCIANRADFQQYNEDFSLYSDYIETVVYSGYMCGFPSDGYFADLDDPESFSSAAQDFRKGKYKKYDTLFLDRDGVINHQIVDDYVKTPEEFEFIDGVLEAMRILNPLFSKIFIVSNQRGVGIGVMSMKDLREINEFMSSEIAQSGGRIDKIYSCTDHDKNSFNRKPNIGMAIKIKEDFPEIDYSKCFMVGDTTSDIKFANNAGIPAILVGDKYANRDRSNMDIVGYYPSLLEFAKSL